MTKDWRGEEILMLLKHFYHFIVLVDAIMINITLLEGNILLPTLWNPLLLNLVFLSKNISVEKSPYRIPEDEAANILNHVSNLLL